MCWQELGYAPEAMLPFPEGALCLFFVQLNEETSLQGLHGEPQAGLLFREKIAKLLEKLKTNG